MWEAATKPFSSGQVNKLISETNSRVWIIFKAPHFTDTSSIDLLVQPGGNEVVLGRQTGMNILPNLWSGNLIAPPILGA